MNAISAKQESPPAQPDVAMPGWWRRNGPWLLGAVLAVAAIFAMAYRDAKQRLEREHPIQVAAGDWGQYAGARWRAVSARRNKVGPGTPFDLRADSEVIGVTFELVADTGAKAEDFGGCTGRMVSADGRRWDANPPTTTRYGAPLPTTCGGGYGPDFERIEPQPGKPYRFMQLFQVPRTQSMQGMHVDIVLLLPKKSPRGSFLRFALPDVQAARTRSAASP